MEELEGGSEPVRWQKLECPSCQHSFEVTSKNSDTVKFQGKRGAGVANMVYLDWTVPCPRCNDPVNFTETAFE